MSHCDGENIFKELLKFTDVQQNIANTVLEDETAVELNFISNA
jgi:hypothetical protein